MIPVPCPDADDDPKRFARDTDIPESAKSTSCRKWLSAILDAGKLHETDVDYLKIPDRMPHIKKLFVLIDGCASWATPYIAELFALARGSKPIIARDEFETFMRETSRAIRFNPQYEIRIPDMPAFAEALHLKMFDPSRHGHSARPLLTIV